MSMTAQSPCQPSAPYLHRTWLKSVKPLEDSPPQPPAMGSALSSPVNTFVNTNRQPHGLALGFGDGPAHQDTRPVKRRRLSSALVDDDLSRRQTWSSLRIDVLKLLHKDSKKVKSSQAATSQPRGSVTTKGCCRITIFDVSSGSPRLLHCQSQLCNLLTAKNPVGPHHLTRIDLPAPFHVPRDSLLINRLDDGSFDLSDSYQLLVELEAALDSPWPPLEPLDLGIPTQALDQSCPVSLKHWLLSSRFDSVFGRLRNPLQLSSTAPSSDLHHQTSYVMDVDLRWASGLKSLRSLDEDSKSCITALDPDEAFRGTNLIAQPRLANGTAEPAVDGIVNGEGSHVHDDDSVGENTPSRSLRAREKPAVYNLKLLSDQALGRDHRRRARSASLLANDGRVQYLLPPDQPISLDCYRCITCGVYHDSMSQLQVHLQTVHSNYDYLLETTGQGPQFRVSAIRDSWTTPNKAHQLSRSVKPFNLYSAAVGDQPWVTSRLVLDAEYLPRSPSVQARSDQPRSTSPTAKTAKPGRRRGAKPKNRKIVVPNIAQPLFHPISKARLVPGQDVPEVVPDDEWLIHRHRECIGDFSDVTAAEKEFIWEWDNFILRRNIMSAAYFPRAWLSFVRDKAAWLVAEDHRMLEFGKHASVLLARDVLNEGDFKEAFACINRAREDLKHSPKTNRATTSLHGSPAAPKLSPRSAQIRKSTSGCALCKLPVRGPTLLICSNTTCPRRLFHSTCVTEALIPVTQSPWLCNSCCLQVDHR